MTYRESLLADLALILAELGLSRREIAANLLTCVARVEELIDEGKRLRIHRGVT